jgi:N-acetylneuraminic acid mutarotase
MEISRTTLLLCAAALAACGDGSSQADGAPSCPSGEPWAAAPPVLLGPTQETAAVALDAKIYVVGGFNTERGLLRAVQIYDTVSCTWSEGPEMPRAVHHANLAVVDGTLYVVGALEGNDFEPIRDVWSWTPGQGDRWNELAPMPTGIGRGSAVAGVIDGTIYLAGGFNGEAVTTVSSFEPSSGVWRTDLPPLPQPREHACGGAVAGTLYVMGGRRGTIASIVATVFAYTPGGAWEERPAMPTARGGTACGVLDDRIVVIGGEGKPRTQTGVFDEVEEFTPATGAWRTLAPMPAPRHGMAAAAWGGRIYVPGGAARDGFAAVATHDVLTP